MQIRATDPNIIISSVGTDFLRSLRMRTSAGEEGFRENYLPLMYQLAKYVQTLPLEKETFVEVGGAFKFAMQAVSLTMRMTGGILFSTKLTSEKLQLLLPQFHQAAFTASLACIPVLIYKNLSITIDDAPWSYLSTHGNLYDAINSSQSKMATVQWNPPNNANVNMLSALILGRFFRSGQFETFDPLVVAEMADAINPTGVVQLIESQMAKIVRIGQIDARKIYQNEKSVVVHELPNSGVLSVGPDLPTTVKTTSIDNTNTPQETTPQEQEDAHDEEYPAYFIDWVNAVTNGPKLQYITEQENGTILVAIQALSGFGFSAGDLAGKFISDQLATNKDTANRTITLHSKLTHLFKAKDA